MKQLSITARMFTTHVRAVFTTHDRVMFTTSLHLNRPFRSECGGGFDFSYDDESAGDAGATPVASFLRSRWR
jgi:hypothetical protein